jgi:hypothetical protein
MRRERRFPVPLRRLPPPEFLLSICMSFHFRHSLSKSKHNGPIVSDGFRVWTIIERAMYGRQGVRHAGFIEGTDRRGCSIGF